MNAAAQPAPGFEEIEPEDLLWLDRICRHNGYMAPQILPRRQYAVLSPFAFTWAIIVGDLGDEWGYSNRWCYDGFAAAATGLANWKESGFTGEPHGWHRHPDTGRRRPDGDESKEYVNP